MQSTIIGVSGPSGSGKSLFSKKISEDLSNNQNTVIISEDGYYRDATELTFLERSVKNYDHPDAFEHELLAEHLLQLKSGKTINVPKYDYINHLRKEESIHTEAAPVIILEGILLFNEKALRNLIDIKIYMDSALDICLSRRIHRDSTDRKRDITSIISQYNNHVRPMYLKFIEPSRKYADIIVPNGGLNRIAIDIVQTKIAKLIKDKN